MKKTILENAKSDRKAKATEELHKAESGLEHALKQLDTAEKEKQRIETEMKNLGKGGVENFGIKSELLPLQDHRDRYSKLLTELTISASNGAKRVEIREPAQVYMNYNLKQKMILAAGTGILGLMSVMLLISYLEWRNRRVDGVDQVVAELGMRVIGTIPAFPSRASPAERRGRGRTRTGGSS